MSGGARILACRKEGAAILAASAAKGTVCGAGASIAGATERQTLRHFA